jgi:hypothetical protein
MRAYCLANPLVFPALAPGSLVRDIIVKWLFHFHNSVNSRKGVDLFDFELLRHFYGIGIHADAVADGRRILKDIEDLWSTVPHAGWSTAVRHLLGLLGGGALD